MEKGQFKAMLAVRDDKRGIEYCQAPFLSPRAGGEKGRMVATDGHLLYAVDVDSNAKGLLATDKAQLKAFVDTWPKYGEGPTNGDGAIRHDFMALPIDSEACLPNVDTVLADTQSKSPDFMIGFKLDVLQKLVKVMKAAGIDHVQFKAPKPRLRKDGDKVPQVLSALHAEGPDWRLVVMPATCDVPETL